jgi:hypothetical protein
VRRLAWLTVTTALAAAPLAGAQTSMINLPKTVAAGSPFSITAGGSGPAVLYIAGPGQVLRRDVQLPGQAAFAAGSLYNAGHYLVILVAGSATDQGSFDVIPVSAAAELSFLAKPSRLPVGLHNSISGAVYVFDAYHNLITAPLPVTFELANATGPMQQRTVKTQYGAAWTEMDSTTKEGIDRFEARLNEISSTRVVEQVPGEPCQLKISAQPHGALLDLKTEPVLDCSGNAVPDGTIVTFTESYGGEQSTADVPLKHGIAEIQMPAHNGAKISAASGVVLGNEFRWQK